MTEDQLEEARRQAYRNRVVRISSELIQWLGAEGDAGPSQVRWTLHDDEEIFFSPGFPRVVLVARNAGMRGVLSHDDFNRANAYIEDLGACLAPEDKPPIRSLLSRILGTLIQIVLEK